jgi:hypothetical protein
MRRFAIWLGRLLRIRRLSLLAYTYHGEEPMLRFQRIEWVWRYSWLVEVTETGWTPLKEFHWRKKPAAYQRRMIENACPQRDTPTGD